MAWPNDPKEKSCPDKFAEETSFHGIPYWLPSSHSVKVRVFYFFIWVGMVVVTGYFLWRNTAAYLEYGAKISIHKTIAQKLTFPAVTICPESNINKTGMNSQTMLTSLSLMRPNTNVDACKNETKFMDPKIDESREYWLNYWWTKGTTGGLDPYLLDFDKMFINCSFMFQSYQCKHLFIGFLTTMGVCYTFNYGLEPNPSNYSMIWVNSKSRKTNLTVSGSGPYNRLQLRLDTNGKETCEQIISDFKGFRMVVHDQMLLPIFPDNSILLEPGKKTQVSVEQSIIDRRKSENLPKSNRCESKKQLYLFSETSYTRGNCLIQCLVEEVYRKCNCLLMYMTVAVGKAHFLLNKHVKNNNANYTMTCWGDIKPMMCQKDIVFPYLWGNGTDKCNEQCPTECYKKDYNLQMSTGFFPPNGLMASITKETQYESINEVKENVLEVDIFLKSMEVTVMEEDWAMTTTELFSNWGGNFGLFLGASIFSFIELIHFLFLAFHCTRNA